MHPFYLVARVALESGVAGAFALFSGGLIGRGFCLRRLITVREARMTLASDTLFWVGAAILVLSRMFLMFSDAGMGRWFHLGNPLTYLQGTLFCLILALEVWPSKKFRSWKRHLDLDQIPYHTDQNNDRMRLIWKIQLVLLLTLPVFDPLVRMGIGLSH